MRVILTNPRYTGRQVWNKQRTDEVLLDVNDVALGHAPVMRWNPTSKWITSEAVVHEPLISDEAFEEAQKRIRSHGRETTQRKPHVSRHPYLFKSLIFCGLCTRRMQGQHSHGVAYYRCRYPQEYALANRIDHPRSVIMREDLLITPLDQWIAREFDPDRREDTIRMVVEQAAVDMPSQVPAASTRHVMERYEERLRRYHAALDAGADPVVVTGWMAEAATERGKALTDAAQFGPSDPPIAQLTVDEITAVLNDLGDVADALRDADYLRGSRHRLNAAFDTA